MSRILESSLMNSSHLTVRNIFPLKSAIIWKRVKGWASALFQSCPSFLPSKAIQKFFSGNSLSETFVDSEYDLHAQKRQKSDRSVPALFKIWTIERYCLTSCCIAAAAMEATENV